MSETSDEIDELVAAAGKTHVIPPRENPRLLERLRDPRVLERAREHLASNDEAWRNSAILCLERIAYVLHDQETAELLLAHASAAKSKYEVARTLDALKICTPPEPLASDPLVALVRRKEWLVWQAAVRCLHLAPADEVEAALIERLDADRYGAVDVAFELRFMASPRSLQALESLLELASLDVRCVALDSLGERLGAGVLPYARRLASGRQFQEKWWAEKWLERYGTAEDVPLMADRLKKLLASQRKRDYGPPEISYLVPFLRRFSGDPDAEAALTLLAKRAERLSDGERRWLETNAPDARASLASPRQSD